MECSYTPTQHNHCTIGNQHINDDQYTIGNQQTINNQNTINNQQLMDDVYDIDELECIVCALKLKTNPFIHVTSDGNFACSFKCLHEYRKFNNVQLPSKYCDYCEMDLSQYPISETVSYGKNFTGVMCYNDQLYCSIEHLLANDKLICPMCKSDMYDKCKTGNFYVRNGTIICNIDCMLKHRQSNKKLNHSILTCNFCECQIKDIKTSYQYMFKKYCNLSHLRFIQRNDIAKEEAAAAKRGAQQHFRHINCGGTAGC